MKSEYNKRDSILIAMFLCFFFFFLLLCFLWKNTFSDAKIAKRGACEPNHRCIVMFVAGVAYITRVYSKVLCLSTDCRTSGHSVFPIPAHKSKIVTFFKVKWFARQCWIRIWQIAFSVLPQSEFGWVSLRYARTHQIAHQEWEACRAFVITFWFDVWFSRPFRSGNACRVCGPRRSSIIVPSPDRSQGHGHELWLDEYEHHSSSVIVQNENHDILLIYRSQMNRWNTSELDLCEVEGRRR